MTPNTPTPDYGEPWREQTVSFMPGTIEDRDGNVVNALMQKLRAISCVNACAGIADPEKEVAAMREAIKEAVTAIDRLTTVATGGMQPANAKQDAIRFGNAALTKLQPFLK